jgi:hypothetical protein
LVVVKAEGRNWEAAKIKMHVRARAPPRYSFVQVRPDPTNTVPPCGATRIFSRSFSFATASIAKTPLIPLPTLTLIKHG